MAKLKHKLALEYSKDYIGRYSKAGSQISAFDGFEAGFEEAKEHIIDALNKAGRMYPWSESIIYKVGEEDE